MKSPVLQRFGSTRAVAVLLILALLLLLLLWAVGLIASYLPQSDPYAYQPHLYEALVPLLSGLALSVYLLVTTQEDLRRPLPLAALAGLVLGIFLGSIYNLPYY